MKPNYKNKFNNAMKHMTMLLIAIADCHEREIHGHNDGQWKLAERINKVNSFIKKERKYVRED